MRRKLLLIVVLLAAAGAAAGAGPGTVGLELLSEYDLPGGTRFAGTCVGGLSALFYDRSNDRYFAVSDSRSDARFYTLRLELGTNGDGTPRIDRLVVDSVVRLLTREGLPYPDARVDPEGFALFDEGSAFVSSEGVADDGVPPFVDRIDVATGEWLATVPLPQAFRPRHDGSTQTDSVQTVGVRNNLGLESLTLSPDRRHLYVASESALAQDAAGLAAGSPHFARVLRFEVAAMPRLAEEVLYPLTMPAGDVVVHGLVELLALDDTGRLLALERTYSRDAGMAVELFEARWDDRLAEVDRSSLSPAARALPVLAKLPVLDFRRLPILLVNFEGLTLGPRLADGSETLVVLADNNNTDCAPPKRPSDLQPTKLLLFRLRRHEP